MSAEATLHVQPNELMVGCPVLSDPEMNQAPRGEERGENPHESGVEFQNICTPYSYENIKKFSTNFQISLLDF